ncbi:branched-chain amino acid aminotransferase [Halanaerobium congolense]|jgi:branched-chain amino acid aminotransferase|uniref:branched-chain-amino-acid transaminase n=1 Tax=Halanaerobium congolense TaxID=54121 RepID=A0A1G8LD64_9FIRM|nr:branched-chain amino acid aminotransferase [Halanaerobium congolense]PUU90313.1 MAG: branched-chain amino acid aminotransferase [Halanaerobium sp.]TDS32955.1 branched-chain amino acid aminotransferase [Halanaerobium congolense]TDX44371.1 branched-chain amino acid aminotransferase [Halanaerobium congolense]SDH57794.1 branched-chain amino acid aminotransferase [Halanaerobium congolense]SDI53659.1 branched-chain amino acid aminotransferase [Halanaerobium congolense]
MTKKNLDWENIGFQYHETDKRYIANYEDGSWGEGQLISDPNIVINESAGVLQYCQQVFEGLKAYTAKDGSIVTFRPDLNAKRMVQSAEGLRIPPFPKERFLEAVDQVVEANQDWVPPYGTGASLYLRPYIFALTPVIGINPAEEYQFRLYSTPVGPYFKGGAKPITLTVSEYDRAAPRGTGHLKAGLNYAMSLNTTVKAHEDGFDENLFLDAATRSYIEESGGANIILITDDKKLVTPKSNSILPSITKRSIIYLAENYLDLEVIERRIEFDELENFTEAGLCGTAAVISPIGKIVNGEQEIEFSNGMNKVGPVIKELYETLTQMQLGVIEAPEGWIRKIK